MKEQSRGMLADESLPQRTLEPLHHYGPVASCGLNHQTTVAGAEGPWHVIMLHNAAVTMRPALSSRTPCT